MYMLRSGNGTYMYIEQHTPYMYGCVLSYANHSNIQLVFRLILTYLTLYTIVV